MPSDSAALPFSLSYGDKPSALLLKNWSIARESRPLDPQRTRHTLNFTDPKTHLNVRWIVTEYHDFPTVEWKLEFKNEGTTDTLLLSDLQAIETRFCRGNEGEFALHHNTGSPCSAIAPTGRASSIRIDGQRQGPAGVGDAGQPPPLHLRCFAPYFRTGNVGTCG
jgi:hypothetical protein